MNKVQPIFFIPLLFLALLLWPGCSGKDPDYQGKPVSAWVSDLQDPDPEVRQNAANALAELVSKDRTMIRPVIQGMKNGNYGAADLLGAWGKDAGDMTTEVVEGFGETMKKKGNLSTRLAAARNLPKFGTACGPAVPGLIEMLKDDSSVIREMAAETLGKLPVDLAKPAVPALMNAAKTDVLAVQQKALESLRIIDPDALKKAGGS